MSNSSRYNARVRKQVGENPMGPYAHGRVTHASDWDHGQTRFRPTRYRTMKERGFKSRPRRK